MKKILFAAIAMFIALPLFSQASKSRTSNSYDGYVKLQTTQLSYPLGRYVQFTSTSLPFKISSPDAQGNGTWTTYFTFEVLRHVPNLQYCNFQIKSVKWNEDRENFGIKFKRDQNAVEQLSEVISNKAISKKTIKFTQSYSDLVAQEIIRARNAFNGQLVDVDYNSISIYCIVPVANVSIEGGGNVRLKEAATIYLDSDENNRTTTKMSVGLKLILDSYYSPNANNQIVVRTDNGEFYKTFENVNLQQYTVSEDIYILGREMDALLSHPVYIDIIIQ